MLEQTITWLSIFKGTILITTAFGGVYGIIKAIKKERSRYATMEFVKRENKRQDKETLLMIESVKESQEERDAIIETMAEQIKFIYQAHYKP